MRKKVWAARVLGGMVAAMTFWGAVAAADDLYYQGPTDGTGLWNSTTATYYSWYDVQTGIQHRDQPLNGDSAFLQQASGHGVSNTTVNFNDLYVNPGLTKLTISSGNTLLQSSAGTAMYAQAAELGLGLTTGTYTMTAGTATFNSLWLGAEANSPGNFNLSVGTVSAGFEQIGLYGPGYFEQHSGQNNCPEIIIGNEASGHYRLDGGSMKSHEEAVANAAGGIFEQVGGANTTDLLTIGSNFIFGSYTLQAGTLSVGSALLVGSAGRFSALGGTLVGGPAASPATITVSPGGQFFLSTPTTISNGFILTFGSTIQMQATSSPLPPTSLTFTSASMVLRGGLISGSGAITVDSASTVRGAGQVVVPADVVTNNGSVIADSGTLLVAASSLSNSGTLRASSGSSLIVQTSNPITNQSIVQADAGGTVSFNTPLTNGSAASISLLGGTIAAPTITNGPGGTLGGLGAIYGNVTNNGITTFIGPSQVIGSFTNNTTLTVRNSQLLVTGAGTNNGTITTVSGGSAVFNGGLTGNPVGASFSGAATLQAGGSLIANYVRQNSLTLQGSASDPSSYSRLTLRRRADGGDSSTLSSLSIQTDASGTPLGRIDLADNSLTINYGAGTSPNAQVRSYLTAGYSHGSWGGPGIGSSVAAADPAHLGLGYADGADGIVAGLAPGQELIRMTRIGDVNLDGAVGFSDLLALAQHYGQSNARWDRGDFNYDGLVNFTDLLLLAQNYGGSAATAGVGSHASFAAVPEPVTVVIVAAPLLLARRRPSDITSLDPLAATRT